MEQIWNRPEMIVLVRRKSDEIILANCRSSGGGVGYANNGCYAFYYENQKKENVCCRPLPRTRKKKVSLLDSER